MLYIYIHTSRINGADQMQAISQAVEATIHHVTHIPHTHTCIWLQPTAIHTLLTLKPHRDTHITYNTHTLFTTIFMWDPTHILTIQGFQQAWLGTLSRVELRSTMEVTTTREDPKPLTPKQAMWEKIWTNYVPSPYPSHMPVTNLSITNPPLPCRWWQPSPTNSSQSPYPRH